MIIQTKGRPLPVICVGDEELKIINIIIIGTEMFTASEELLNKLRERLK